MSRREPGRDDVESPDGQSPLKSRRADEPVITAAVLQKMLSETQAAIVNSQKELLREELSRLDQKTEARFSKVEEELSKHEDRFAVLEKTVLALRDRDGEGSSTAASSAERHRDDRLVMIVGGWPRDTRRHLILEKLQGIIQDLSITDMLDRDPFVTGPRRSFAMIPFAPRRGESREDCKNRMHRVIGIVMKARIRVPAQDRPLWAAMSKSPEERLRSAHCSLVRSVVRFFKPTKLDDLDVEYNRGVCWMGEHTISGATSVCQDPDAKVWTDMSRDFKPWINITALSNALQADPEEILSYLQKQKEDRTN